MEEIVSFSPSYWHWLILGVALMAAEAVVPGVYLLWIGLAALLSGGVAYVLPDLGWQIHALFFAVMSIVAALVGHRLYACGIAGDTPVLNRRGSEFIGQVHVLKTPISDGGGRLHVADSSWRVIGPDLPAGTPVRVVAVKGVSLVVEKVDPGNVAEGDGKTGQP